MSILQQDPMMFPRLQKALSILFILSSSAFFSQQTSDPNKGIFSQDSLAGFDEATKQKEATEQGLYGMEYASYLRQQKRLFINDKYSLPAEDYEAAYVASYKYSPA